MALPKEYNLVPNEKGLFECDCCKKYTLAEKNDYRYCRECGWIDDWYHVEFPDEVDGPNPVSLNEGRKMYARGELIGI